MKSSHKAVEEYKIPPEIQLAIDTNCQEGFEEIYNNYKGRVYAKCLKMLKDTVEAEELTQAVFVQVYKKLHQFRGESQFATWLYRLTTNEVLQHFRRTKRQRENSLDDCEKQRLVIKRKRQHILSFRDCPATVQVAKVLDDPSSNTEVEVVQKAPDVGVQIDLERFVNALSPQYKRIFTMFYVDGFSHEEIAQQLGIHSGTSKSNLWKVRQKAKAFFSSKPELSFNLI